MGTEAVLLPLCNRTHFSDRLLLSMNSLQSLGSYCGTPSLSRSCAISTQYTKSFSSEKKRRYSLCLLRKKLIEHCQRGDFFSSIWMPTVRQSPSTGEVAHFCTHQKKHKLRRADYIEKLPLGTHSTKGCGSVAPDASQSHFTEDNLEIPYGTAQDSNIKNSSLVYNEFIVYDTAQVKMKYLLKLDFKYKY